MISEHLAPQRKNSQAFTKSPFLILAHFRFQRVSYLRSPSSNDAQPQWPDKTRPQNAYGAFLFFLFILSGSLVSSSAQAREGDNRGTLKELHLSKSNESDNLKTAAHAENLISQTEENAINDLKRLIAKYKGTQQEPDLLFRLGELYARRSKTGLFVDLYKGDKTLQQILKPQFSVAGTKAYLEKAINTYKDIIQRFPHYPARDEVLFNMAFASDQKGDLDEAQKQFLKILELFPQSPVLPETHMALGEIFFQKQNYLKAQEHFEKVQSWPRAPIAPIALYKSAWCAYNLHNNQLALNRLEKLLRESKKNKSSIHIRTEARRDLALFYSEVGAASQALAYFSTFLDEDELGLVTLDLAEVFDKFGRQKEMSTLLASFLKTWPKHPQSGLVWMKQIEYLNSQKNLAPMMEGLEKVSQLCGNEKWTTQSSESSQFCKNQWRQSLHDYVIDWSEIWAQSKNDFKQTKELNRLYELYLQAEEKNSPDRGLQLNYAHFLFSQKNFSLAREFYQRVNEAELALSQQKDTDVRKAPEKNKPSKALEEALYGRILSTDKLLEEKNNDPWLRQELHQSLSLYMTHAPDGSQREDVLLKKAFLFYQEKEYDQALLAIGKIKGSQRDLQEKKEDLLLEIHRVQKDYVGLAKECFKILPLTKDARHEKIKSIYQGAQEAIIEEKMASKNLAEAALLSEDFYREHQPEEKALARLDFAVQIWVQLKKYRQAAIGSEKLAKHFKEKKQWEQNDKSLQRAYQLYLQIGDLAQTQRVLESLINGTPSPELKKDSLTLFAEISSWIGPIEKTEWAWELIEKSLKPQEKSAFLDMKIKTLEQTNPLRAQKLKTNLIQNQIEPYYGDYLLEEAKDSCQKKNWSLCYQRALKLNRPEVRASLKTEARRLQAEVLIQEYYGQSSRSSKGQWGLVLALKAEKFDKALQVLQSLTGKDEDLNSRLAAGEKIIALYQDYTEQLERALPLMDPSLPDTAAIQQEVTQILPVLKQKPDEVRRDLASLKKTNDGSHDKKANGTSTRFANLTGTEMRIYVPTWEEAFPQRPLDEWKTPSLACSTQKQQSLKTLSALGREANHCLALKKTKDLESLALRISEEFPDSPWGPFYLSVSAAQQKRFDQAHWYLKLAQKRESLSHFLYEDARQSHLHHPEVPPNFALLKLDSTWAASEEPLFLKILTHLAKGDCQQATDVRNNLQSQYWKSTALNKTIEGFCQKDAALQKAATAQTPNTTSPPPQSNLPQRQPADHPESL